VLRRQQLCASNLLSSRSKWFPVPEWLLHHSSCLRHATQQLTGDGLYGGPTKVSLELHQSALQWLRPEACMTLDQALNKTLSSRSQQAHQASIVTPFHIFPCWSRIVPRSGLMRHFQSQSDLGTSYESGFHLNHGSPMGQRVRPNPATLAL